MVVSLALSFEVAPICISEHNKKRKPMIPRREEGFFVIFEAAYFYFFLGLFISLLTTRVLFSFWVEFGSIFSFYLG